MRWVHHSSSTRHRTLNFCSLNCPVSAFLGTLFIQIFAVPLLRPWNPNRNPFVFTGIQYTPECVPPRRTAILNGYSCNCWHKDGPNEIRAGLHWFLKSWYRKLSSDINMLTIERDQFFWGCSHQVFLRTTNRPTRMFRNAFGRIMVSPTDNEHCVYTLNAAVETISLDLRLFNNLATANLCSTCIELNCSQLRRFASHPRPCKVRKRTEKIPSLIERAEWSSDRLPIGPDLQTPHRTLLPQPSLDSSAPIRQTSRRRLKGWFEVFWVNAFDVKYLTLFISSRYDISLVLVLILILLAYSPISCSYFQSHFLSQAICLGLSVRATNSLKFCVLLIPFNQSNFLRNTQVDQKHLPTFMWFITYHTHDMHFPTGVITRRKT